MAITTHMETKFVPDTKLSLQSTLVTNISHKFVPDTKMFPKFLPDNKLSLSLSLSLTPNYP